MKEKPAWPLNLVLAEDTETDAELFRLAVARVGTVQELLVLEDGQELIDYLLGQDGHPAPDIIFLDLKMPKLDGFDVLKWLKRHPKYAVIPTIMFSNSYLEADVLPAYQLGANAFFAKPSSFADFVSLLQVIFLFWSRAERPKRPRLADMKH